MSQDKIQRVTDKGSFSDADFFSFDQTAIGKARRLDDDSKKMWKEVGGVGCYSMNGNKIRVKNLFEVRPASLHAFQYDVDWHSLKGTSDVYCGNNKPLIFHTHPNGVLLPSEQDRLSSAYMDSVQCVIARGDVACYFGNKDLYPSR